MNPSSIPPEGWRFIGRVLCATDEFKILYEAFGLPGSKRLGVQQGRVYNLDGSYSVGRPFPIQPVQSSEEGYFQLYQLCWQSFNIHTFMPSPSGRVIDAWYSYLHMLKTIREIISSDDSKNIWKHFFTRCTRAFSHVFWQSLHGGGEVLIPLLCNEVFPLIIACMPSWSNESSVFKAELEAEMNGTPDDPPYWLNVREVRDMLEGWGFYVERSGDRYYVVPL